MMKRIVCVEDAALEKVFPERWPAIVKMELKGGAVYTARVEYPRGDPENPLSWDEIIEKFKSLAGAVLPEARLEEIISRIRALDKEDDISRFCALLSKRPRRR